MAIPLIVVAIFAAVGLLPPRPAQAQTGLGRVPPATATTAPSQTGTASPQTAQGLEKTSLTVQEVLARSIAARGGSQKLHAVVTRRETGRLALGEGSEWPFVVEHKRPRSLRMDIDMQSAKFIRAYDGRRGWQLQPQSKTSEALSTDEVHNIANEADFDFAGALVDTNTKGSAELLGKEPYDGHDAYKVKVTLLTGDVFYYHIDSTSYLPIHWEGARLINSKPVGFESSFTDYRDVDGVKYPFLIVSWLKGSTQRQKLIFAKIETNPPIDDSRFADAAPAPPATPAPAPAPPPAPPTTQPPPR